MNAMFADFHHCAAFLAVYITEAHAVDEWPMGTEISVCSQPKNSPDRIALANSYRQQFHLEVPLLVDAIDNQFEKTFAAWPFRFFIVIDGKLVMKAQPHGHDDPHEFAYNVDEIRQWLERFQSEH